MRPTQEHLAAPRGALVVPSIADARVVILEYEVHGKDFRTGHPRQPVRLGRHYRDRKIVQVARLYGRLSAMTALKLLRYAVIDLWRADERSAPVFVVNA